MVWVPVLVRGADRGGRPVLRLGHGQLDRYLEFVAARARPNTVLATGYDLKVFFSAVSKDPVAVTTADVLGFITAQRGDRKVVRLPGVSNRIWVTAAMWMAWFSFRLPRKLSRCRVLPPDEYSMGAVPL